MHLVTLHAGDASVVLAPEIGGAVARYSSHRGGATIDWLRATTAEALLGADPYHTAGFPLVPYSNRIREGRFTFEGRAVALPPNALPERHSIHGHGWQAAWAPVEVSASHADLEYRYPAGAWPWPYRARQRVSLFPGHLAVELTLTSEAAAPMPAGLGWHPYFPRTPRTTVTAAVSGLWLSDDEVMPTGLASPPPPSHDPTRGLRVDQVALDNCFIGWDRRAVVEWPERRARVVVTAAAPLDFLMVYTPPGRDFFCLEPVSHAIDAVNLAAAGRTDVGFRVLEPGGTLRATVTLTPELSG
jgi:aldose 1-epimerase